MVAMGIVTVRELVNVSVDWCVNSQKCISSYLMLAIKKPLKSLSG